VWLGELPALPEAHEDVCYQLELEAEPLGRPGRPVCVEIALPRGPRQLYGLLGAEHLPADGSALEVVVPAAFERGPIVADALSNPIEQAYSGLTPEYAQAVTAALTSAELPFPPPTPGALRYTRAAQGIVGSAPIVFSTLAPLIVEFMFSEIGELEPSAVSQRLAASFGLPSPS
jgi:hypothetical protein